MKEISTSSLLISLMIGYLVTPAIGTSFTSDLTYAIAHEKVTENVVFSPASIKYALGLTYLGAESTTAAEFETVLHFPIANKEETAKQFGQLTEKLKNITTPNSIRDDFSFGEPIRAELKIANRVYVADKYSLAPKFNELASKHFDSAAENVKFSDAAGTANKINAWVEENTNKKILNLIDPNTLSDDMRALLINAIYFKADWALKFEKSDTRKQNFSVSATRKVEVDMMHKNQKFQYASLDDLNAIAVELPYRETDLAMLIILPKEIDGLLGLENKLKHVDLTKISDKFEREEVHLSIPKFKIEFDITLNDVLQKLGLNAMFSDSADFGGLVDGGDGVKVDEVKHKAFIEVNERGTEASAATYVKMHLKSARIVRPEFYDFIADHPFFFAIKDNENVYFAGHVATF